ncbi:response regulator [Aureisphaera galaxeae]|uniref:ATP-binding protein n=1 Tax=Aureisphaera galaxeae TaxID=1538023 RepID=UPI00234FC997|nr:ATP-binding protein [Aureisphaera galaxeae]MDC8004128.1 response regulator [Aureisphaera galaxeae]
MEKVEGNLSNENITSIDQDDKGFIWLGTEDGLNRYDGHHFDALRSDPEKESWLPANYISDIAISHDGNYWLATWGGGMSRFRPDSLSFDNFFKNKGFGPRYILSLQKMDNGNLGLTTDEGVFVYVRDNGNFIKIPEGQRTSKIAAFGNTLWLANKNRLFKYDMEKRQITLHYDAKDRITLLVPHDKGVTIGMGTKLRHLVHGKLIKEEDTKVEMEGFVKRSDAIYLHSRSEIFELELDYFALKKVPLDIKAPFNSLKTLFVDRDGLLWVGTSHGVFKERQHTETFNKAFPQIHARRTLRWENRIYAGGLNGLFVLDSIGVRHQILNEPILSLKRFDSILWAGTGKGEIFRIYNDNVISRTKLNTNLRVMGIERDKKNRIWVGSWNGVHLLDEDGTELRFFNLDASVPSNEAKIIQMLRDTKDRLWVITAAFGVYCIKDVSEFPLQSSQLPSINYRHLRKDLNSITSNVITTLTEDKKGTIWFGMDTGIVSFNEQEENFSRLRNGGHLFDKKIMALRSDLDNRLWISTIGDGLYVYDQENGQFFNYTVEDGLISNSFLYSSGYYFDNDHILYFGTDKGIQAIDINRLESPSLKKEVGISNISIQHKQGEADVLPFNAPYAKDIKLNYTENNFSIRFSNLDYEHNNKVRYAYALDNEDWVVADHQTAYFTRIPFGNHELKVKDLYHLGEIGVPDNVFRFQMYIAPPWYLSWWAYAGYGIMLLLVLFSIYALLLRQRLAKSETQRTKEFDLVKSKMYANISHEFRTPLTIINGLTDALLKDKSSNTKEHKRVSGIKKNSDQLLHLVNQMLDLVSLDVQQMQVHYKHGDLIGFVGKCISFYRAYTDSKQQELVFLTQMESLFMDIDDDKLQKVVNNLLSNAIKFTPAGGKITVHIGCDEELKQVVLTLSDTGKGISEEDLPYIFDRYYKTFDTESNLGNGIGMALTKELVELLDGSISVESNILKGTTFKITLPILKNASSSHSLTFKSPYVDELVASPKTPLNPFNEKKHTVLLVEDNEELLQYMKGLLMQKYRLYTAKNGKEGLRIAKNKKVDFIISDIMMPVMDGHEFCKQIKSKVETSHIPFIMLTAKTDTQSKVDAYEIGIDAYLEKPFNSDELLAIIDSIFVKNSRRIKQFSSLLNLKGVNDNYKDINQLDIEFIQKIQELVVNNRVKVSTESLVNSLGTSRTQLHRKVKALTGMSIMRYVNRIRLERAKELLEKSQLSVSEIAYEVGFEDTSYFSSNFKKMYKATPSSFRK